VKNKYDPVLLANGQWDVGGILVTEPCNELSAMLYAFVEHTIPSARSYLFWRIADVLWNGPERPNPLFERHPWAEQMISAAAKEKYLAIGGAASSGKSYVMAGWAVVNWLAAP
jgi:hypothetical protein